MNPNLFTRKLQEAFQEAQNLALNAGQTELSSAHVFAALLSSEDGLTRPILEKLGVDASTIESELGLILDKLPSASGSTTGQIYLSSDLRDTMAHAEKVRSELGDEFTSIEHFLSGLIAAGNTEVKAILIARGVTEKTLSEAITAIRGSQKVTDQDPEGKQQRSHPQLLLSL